jgi:hypothetical protein
MAVSMFTDKNEKPNKEKLSEVLGKSYKYWDEIKSSLENQYGPMTEEWKHYGQKSGWILKLLYKKRNLFFFNPQDKFFAIGFVFGDKAVAEVEKSDLPSEMIDELKNAKKYVEGRGLRLEIKKKELIKHVLKLVEIKIKN